MKHPSGSGRQPRDGRSRRDVLGLAAAGWAATFIHAHAADDANDPPRFETARRQFTILRPARLLQAAPALRLDGAIIDLARMRGKVVLVNFWATWCPACRTELPVFERLRETSDPTRLHIAAVSVDKQGRKVVEPFLKQQSVHHLAIYLDPEGRLANAVSQDHSDAPFTLYGMPITYVIGPHGIIEGYMPGDADWTSRAARDLLDYYGSR